MKGERSTPSFASKHSAEEEKSGHIQSWSQSQLLPHGKNGGAEHRPPSCCPSQRHRGDTHRGTQPGCAGATPHSTLLSMTLNNSFKSASTFPHQLSSPLPIFIPTRMCVVFLGDWKSYRSSLNLRGQAEQTGRDQNSSGCLTHTGFEIMYRLHYLLLNIHIVCYSLSLLILKACSETDMSWGRHKYQKVLLYLFQSP